MNPNTPKRKVAFRGNSLFTLNVQPASRINPPNAATKQTHQIPSKITEKSTLPQIYTKQSSSIIKNPSHSNATHKQNATSSSQVFLTGVDTTSVREISFAPQSNRTSKKRLQKLQFPIAKHLGDTKPLFSNGPIAKMLTAKERSLAQLTNREGYKASRNFQLTDGFESNQFMKNKVTNPSLHAELHAYERTLTYKPFDSQALLKEQAALSAKCLNRVDIIKNAAAKTVYISRDSEHTFDKIAIFLKHCMNKQLICEQGYQSCINRSNKIIRETQALGSEKNIHSRGKIKQLNVELASLTAQKAELVKEISTYKQITGNSDFYIQLSSSIDALKQPIATSKSGYVADLDVATNLSIKKGALDVILALKHFEDQYNSELSYTARKAKEMQNLKLNYRGTPINKPLDRICEAIELDEPDRLIARNTTERQPSARPGSNSANQRTTKAVDSARLRPQANHM